jgi:thiamine kinase-like enzyme
MVSKSLFEHHCRRSSELQVRSKLWSCAEQPSDYLTSSEQWSSRVDDNV